MLADVTAAFVAEHPVPVYAQWEVARFLQADGVPGVTSIEPTTAADGTVVYLSTRGVADAAVSDAAGCGDPARNRRGDLLRGPRGPLPAHRQGGGHGCHGDRGRRSAGGTTQSRASPGPAIGSPYLTTDLTGGRLLL